MSIQVKRSRSPLYYELEEISCAVEPPEAGKMRYWTLEGPVGEGCWTDEEIETVNGILCGYPQPWPLPWHGVASWHLWKKPASAIDADQRPTFAIGKESASQRDYVGALQHKELRELLRIWEAIQRNTGSDGA